MTSVDAARSSAFSVPAWSGQAAPLPPQPKSDTSGKVEVLAADSPVAKSDSDGMDQYRHDLQKTKEDAEWWLEPAGYAPFENGQLFAENDIEGVLYVSGNLFGVATKSEGLKWVSRLENPIAFKQAQEAYKKFDSEIGDFVMDSRRTFELGGFSQIPYNWDGSIGIEAEDIHSVVALHDRLGILVKEDGELKRYHVHMDLNEHFTAAAMDLLARKRAEVGEGKHPA